MVVACEGGGGEGVDGVEVGVWVDVFFRGSGKMVR